MFILNKRLSDEMIMTSKMFIHKKTVKRIFHVNSPVFGEVGLPSCWQVTLRIDCSLYSGNFQFCIVHILEPFL